MMMQQTFSFSEKTLLERKKRMALMMGTMPVIMILFAYIFLKKSDVAIEIDSFVRIFAIVIPLFLLEFFVVGYFMLKKIKQMMLIIDENSISRVGGKSKEVVLFQDIQNVVVRRDVRNDILLIKLRYDQKKVVLAGFDDMEMILNLITAQGIPSQEKPFKADWNSPWIMLLVMLLTTGVIGAMIALDMKIYNGFNLLFGFGFGIYFIVFKPISGSVGKRFRAFEWIIGSLIIGANLVSVWGIFMAGRV